MAADPALFHESNLWSTPIRDLGLTTEGTRLERILAEFEGELHQAGITRVRPPGLYVFSYPPCPPDPLW